MFMVFSTLIAAAIGYNLYRAGVMVGETRERTRRVEAEAKAAAKRAADAEPFPEPEADDDEDDVDICLRVGMPVVCRLSDVSHTHGVILGFAMSADPDGPMLAVVDVNAPHPMPIDVDLVEPRGQPAPAGYRESANPNKQWN